MKKTAKWAAVAAVTAAITIASGCSSSYYVVKDPLGGGTYYTNEIKDVETGGAIKFKDAKTGSTVTIQNSEWKEISSGEFEAGLKAAKTEKAPAATAPAPIPAPTTPPPEK